ncbi:MAG TPA: hypothetical protein VFK25_07850 [Candidatus Binatia bacterium]|nr:hypothetical protein [Candidatus Binatia bacterium]
MKPYLVVDADGHVEESSKGLQKYLKRGESRPPALDQRFLGSQFRRRPWQGQ